MDFQFDGSQDFQLEAIEAITDLFEGQARHEADFAFTFGSTISAVRNQLDLNSEQLLENLREVQTRNGLEADDRLELLATEIDMPGGSETISFPNFSVEMETGTGKTYVYLRTALELHQRYGFRKFIVVVPSRAIREGVLKDLSLTRQHFRDLYDKVPYRFYRYDSSNLSQVRQFALSNSIEFMVMTLDSFNKATNIIFQSTDRLQGETPLHLIQAARPILILDEPQNMESELSIRSLGALHPLLALRYSATHRNPYNVVYRLTPYDAYRRGLVKRIEVASVVTEDDSARPYVRLDRVATARRTVTAAITVHKLRTSGMVSEGAVTVRAGDDLRAKTRRQEYDGYVVDEINVAGEFVRFANGVELAMGETVGEDRHALFESQISYTISEHMRKQARVKDRGIKVLSLFFIDKVASYVGDEPIIRRMFDDAFDRLKEEHPDWASLSAEEVRSGYFSHHRNARSGEVRYFESSTGDAQRDESAYDLIMRNKEQLLSFEEPVSFIFSHSALREGWDNPNIFQVCTLNQAASEMRKRQEIGRGVRLARDQDGARIRDESVNVLTVVANESYEAYVAQLQSEVEDEYGDTDAPPKPKNARKRATITLQKERMLSDEFEELWQRIRQKTRYSVSIDSARLIRDVAQDLEGVSVPSPRVQVAKAQVQVGDEDSYEALQVSAAKTVMDLAGRYPAPNLVDLVAHHLEHTSPPVRLTRATLLAIYEKTSNQEAALTNPAAFASAMTRAIQRRLHEQIIDGIKYERCDEWYEMSQFVGAQESWTDNLVSSPRGLYDHTVIDSEVERQFAVGLESRDDVKLYVKLPPWFTVLTPVGEYNPDWAIVMARRDVHGEPTGEDDLYLVRETKGSTDLSDLRIKEAQKVKCGAQHFKGALGLDYSVVVTANELP